MSNNKGIDRIKGLFSSRGPEIFEEKNISTRFTDVLGITYFY